MQKEKGESKTRKLGSQRTGVSSQHFEGNNIQLATKNSTKNILSIRAKGEKPKWRLMSDELLRLEEERVKLWQKMGAH